VPRRPGRVGGAVVSRLRPPPVARVGAPRPAGMSCDLVFRSGRSPLRWSGLFESCARRPCRRADRGSARFHDVLGDRLGVFVECGLAQPAEQGAVLRGRDSTTLAVPSVRAQPVRIWHVDDVHRGDEHRARHATGQRGASSGRRRAAGATGSGTSGNEKPIASGTAPPRMRKAVWRPAAARSGLRRPARAARTAVALDGRVSYRVDIYL